MAPLLGNITGLFGGEGMILIILLLLLFYGRNLPSVGRSLGKGISEFKRGLKGLEDDADVPPPAPRQAEYTPEAPRPPQRIAPPAPKFENPEAPRVEKPEANPSESKSHYS